MAGGLEERERETGGYETEIDQVLAQLTARRLAEAADPARHGIERGGEAGSEARRIVAQRKVFSAHDLESRAVEKQVQIAGTEVP